MNMKLSKVENSMTKEMTSEGSKVNFYSPEAESEIKQGAQ